MDVFPPYLLSLCIYFYSCDVLIYVVISLVLYFFMFVIMYVVLYLLMSFVMCSFFM